MNRIDGLAKEPLSTDVPFRELASVCEVFSGHAFKSDLFNSEGDGLPLIRIRDVNTGFANTYYSGDYHDRYVVNDGDILIGMDGDFRARVWRNGRGLLNQRVCRLENFTPGVLPKFILYKIQDELDRIQNETDGSTVKHLSSRSLQLARVPIPPLEVQREIVGILDRFTELEAELETELAAELKARRRQYQHWRDDLLRFSDRNPVAWSPMGDVGRFIRGRRFTKADYVDEGIPCIHYGEVYTEFGVTTRNTISKVRPDMRGNLRFAEPGDVILVDVGETVEDVGKAVAWLGDGEVAIHDHCYAYRHDMNPSFVAYYMQTSMFTAAKAQHVARTKVKTLLINGLSKVLIPVPPLAEQQRIVDHLDAMDALVNDISVGLQAELAARRKQYEYYRDKLLTFEELV